MLGLLSLSFLFTLSHSQLTTSIFPSSSCSNLFTSFTWPLAVGECIWNVFRLTCDNTTDFAIIEKFDGTACTPTHLIHRLELATGVCIPSGYPIWQNLTCIRGNTSLALPAPTNNTDNYVQFENRESSCSGIVRGRSWHVAGGTCDGEGRKWYCHASQNVTYISYQNKDCTGSQVEYGWHDLSQCYLKNSLFTNGACGAQLGPHTPAAMNIASNLLEMQEFTDNTCATAVSHRIVAGGSCRQTDDTKSSKIMCIDGKAQLVDLEGTATCNVTAASEVKRTNATDGACTMYDGVYIKISGCPLPVAPSASPSMMPSLMPTASNQTAAPTMAPTSSAVMHSVLALKSFTMTVALLMVATTLM